jgi:hypothetical protein
MATTRSKESVRKVSLTASQAGMTRLRDKGGASPNTLNELTNGYVNAARTPTQRGGTTWKFNYADSRYSKTGNAGKTKGLMSWCGMLWTFAAGENSTSLATARDSGITTSTTSTYVVPTINVTGTFTVSSSARLAVGMVISVNDGSTFITGTITSIVTTTITLRTLVIVQGQAGNTIATAAVVQGFPILILRHPTNNVSATLSKIHYAKPFMGFPYVVAEFSDGVINHFWLQNPPVWQPSTTFVPSAYNANQLVQPNPALSPNPPLTGYYYQAIQVANPPAWTPLLQHQVYDVVQPTVYNGWQEQAYQIFGNATGASTNTTATVTIPAVGSTTAAMPVSSVAGFQVGTIVTIVAPNPGGLNFAPLAVFTAKITALGGSSITATIQAVMVGAPGVFTAALTISYILARSGSTEPTWVASNGGTVLDVSASSPPPVPAAPTTQPGTIPPGLGGGLGGTGVGKYTNIGGNSQTP